MGNFGWNLKKTIAIFQVSTLEFFNMRSFMQNWKILTFGQKMLYLGIFGLELWKSHCHIWNQHPQICLITKSGAKQKSLNLGQKMLNLHIFGWNLKILLCYVSNQRPWICLVGKFGAKIKTLKFGTRSALFWYSWAGIWKNCCHIWNQHPQICLIADFAKNKISKFVTKNV